MKRANISGEKKHKEEDEETECEWGGDGVKTSEEMKEGPISREHGIKFWSVREEINTGMFVLIITRFILQISERDNICNTIIEYLI